MSEPVPSQNPHPPGTFMAAFWNLDRALERLKTTTAAEARKDMARGLAAWKKASRRMRP